MTRFEATGTRYQIYNTVILETNGEMTYGESIDSSSTGLRDTNYWNYQGMKELTNRLTAATSSALGI